MVIAELGISAREFGEVRVVGESTTGELDENTGPFSSEG